MSWLIAVAALGGLTALLGCLLALASRRLAVHEEPRLERAVEMLPGNNCGACGRPGCRAFAEALLAGEAQPGECTVATAASRNAIGALLGIAVVELEPRVARLACAGGDNVARPAARYAGLATCRAAATVAGGGKACAWGCLGYGDCETACTFDAIRMDAHRLPTVDEAACTACGDCVTACPKHLFAIHPVSHRLWVACNSRQHGDAVLDACAVGCTACGKCAADAPRAVRMAEGLPVVDYAASPPRAAIERCPTGAIVWLEPGGRAARGRAAPRIVRETPLPA